MDDSYAGAIFGWAIVIAAVYFINQEIPGKPLNDIEYLVRGVVQNDHCPVWDYRDLKRQVERSQARHASLDSIVADDFTIEQEIQLDAILEVHSRLLYCEEGVEAVRSRCDDISSPQYGSRRKPWRNIHTVGAVGRCKVAHELSRASIDPVTAAAYAESVWDRYNAHREEPIAAARLDALKRETASVAREAASFGHPQAQFRACSTILEFRHTADYGEALRLCRAAWDEIGHPAAAAYVGYYFEAGLQGPRNADLALAWYKAAHGKGYAVGDRIAALEREIQQRYVPVQPATQYAETSQPPPAWVAPVVIGGTIVCALWKKCRDAAADAAVEAGTEAAVRAATRD